MADTQQIEQELREYLTLEPNLRRSDRIVYLMKIINKHFDLEKMDHMITHRDFQEMISTAKTMYAERALPVRVSRETIDSHDVRHILMIESFCMYLNKNKLLRRLVKFDFTR